MSIAVLRSSAAAGSLFALLVLPEVFLAGPALPPPQSPQLLTTVAWEASPSPEVTGYAIYYQIANLPVTNRMDVGWALSVTIPLIVGSIHSIHAVAYTADGVESEPSNVLSYTPPPMTPIKLSKSPDGSMQLRFRTSPLTFCWVEWTSDLDQPDWQTLGLGWLLSDGDGDIVVSDFGGIQSPSRYFRAAKF